jgi:hypothetical protein
MKVHATRAQLLAALASIPEIQRTPVYWSLYVDLSTDSIFRMMPPETRMFVDINDDAMYETVNAMLMAVKVSA